MRIVANLEVEKRNILKQSGSLKWIRYRELGHYGLNYETTISAQDHSWNIICGLVKGDVWDSSSNRLQGQTISHLGCVATFMNIYPKGKGDSSRILCRKMIVKMKKVNSLHQRILLEIPNNMTWSMNLVSLEGPRGSFWPAHHLKEGRGHDN